MKEDMKKAGIMLTMLGFGFLILLLYGGGSDNSSRTMCGLGTGLVVGGITYYANNLDKVNKDVVFWFFVVCFDFLISSILVLLIYEVTSGEINAKTISLISVLIIVIMLVLISKVRGFIKQQRN